MATAALWLFWVSAGVVFYTYLGFPLLLALRARLAPRPVRRGEITPALSLIVVAYNEAEVTPAKVANSLTLDYPPERLEILFASDGSDDGTVELARRHGGERVRVLDLPRRGKNAALNDAVAESTGEILVLTDADSLLDPATLRRIAAPFADPEVGGVVGDFHYLEEGSGDGAGAGAGDRAATAAGERTYWGYDRAVKELQSRAGSVTQATGQLYAVRRGLFVPVPDGILDDFHTSTRAVAAGQRLVFEPGAVARGALTPSEGMEFQRKIRIATRGLTTLLHLRGLLNPFRHGFYALQLASHKLLRWTLGPPILGSLVGAALLWNHGPLYRLALLLQLALHGLALFGLLLRNTSVGRWRLLRLPFYFDLVNTATSIAAVRVLTGRRAKTWVPQR